MRTNLSPQKRNQMLLVVILTGMVLAGLWFGVIKSQKRALLTLSKTKVEVRQKLEQMTLAIKTAGSLKAELDKAGQVLSSREAQMASGDLYAWAIDLVRQFKTSYRVDIPQFSQVDGPKEVTMFPKFPYKQASLTIGGTAFYHDLGRFIADLENEYPYIRVQNLTLEPAPGATGADVEKLAFRMDIVTLVKTSAS